MTEQNAPERIWATGTHTHSGSWNNVPQLREWRLDQVEYVRADLTLSAALDVPEVKALVRQAMAAWQMAYMEPDRDDLDRAEADRISAKWFAHWMALNHPTDADISDHFGDCTGHNTSCLRCNADDVLASVDAALAALKGSDA